MANVKLSASRIKTLNSCSWIYHCNYVLKLPDISNTGAQRGLVVHTVLEELLDKKNKKEVNKILEAGTVTNNKIFKMILEEAKKSSVDTDEHLQLIDQFILTALRWDFYCEGAIEVESEKEFMINSEAPNYTIGGYIDKIAKYESKHGKKVMIADYKCSKAKFNGEEATFNIQALMYSLAARHMFPSFKERELKFLFLKFKQKPEQIYTFTDEQLDGFELYLEHVTNYLNGFDIQRAHSSFAADSASKKWLCGKKKGDLNVAGEPAFICKFKYPYKYYAIINEKAETVSTAFEKKDLSALKKGETIVQKEYLGCPRFRNKL